MARATFALVNQIAIIFAVRSIMHYPKWAFTNNGYDTITPHDIVYLDIIGELPDISNGDIQRINNMYQC